jgi:hypothetical protein
MNAHRRDEPVVIDTAYSDTPAIDGGETAAQIFVGTKSLVTDVEGMKSDKQFVNILEDNIRHRGAPTKLISDRAQVEISAKVKDILRALCISDWQREPHQQHQNPAEQRRYQTVSRQHNTRQDWFSRLPLVVVSYVCLLSTQQRLWVVLFLSKYLLVQQTTSVHYYTPISRRTPERNAVVGWVLPNMLAIP